MFDQVISVTSIGTRLRSTSMWYGVGAQPRFYSSAFLITLTKLVTHFVSGIITATHATVTLCDQWGRLQRVFTALCPKHSNNMLARWTVFLLLSGAFTSERPVTEVLRSIAVVCKWMHVSISACLFKPFSTNLNVVFISHNLLQS